MAVGMTSRTNADQIMASLEAKGRRMSDVIRYAVNDTVDDMIVGQRIEMRRVFDNPRPYTLNALFGRYGTKRSGSVRAGIAFREFTAKGTPAYKYLMPNIKGGQRRFKRSENVLKGLGLLTGGNMTVQGDEFQRDQYGDITGGQYTRMLAELGANTIGMKGPKAQRSPRTKGNKRFFAMPRKGGRKNDGMPMAIAERRGKEIVLMLVMTRKLPTYKPIYDFYGLAQRQVHYSLPKHFNRVFNRMMGGGGLMAPPLKIAA